MNDEYIKIFETFTKINFENFKMHVKYNFTNLILNINRNGYFIIYPVLENYKIAKDNSIFKSEVILFLFIKYLNIMFYIKGNNFRIFKWDKSFNYYVKNLYNLEWINDFLNEFYIWYNKEVMKNG